LHEKITSGHFRIGREGTPKPMVRAKIEGEGDTPQTKVMSTFLRVESDKRSISVGGGKAVSKWEKKLSKGAERQKTNLSKKKTHNQTILKTLKTDGATRENEKETREKEGPKQKNHRTEVTKRKRREKGPLETSKESWKKRHP